MRNRPLALTLLSFLVFSMSFMFVHAQSCGLVDTIVINPNSSLSFDISIADYFNDDLSDPAQGLCGVELSFVHQYVENLEISLTSPAGQSVNLVGPNSDDQFDFTIGTEWQISFVNCATIPAPDPVFSPQWDNTQTENWVNFGLYTGSYHPYIGCLEDFNTGTVNGNWTLTLNNNPSNNPGAVIFLNLLFCDSRGVECCFTTPGVLLNNDITACEGADTLLIDPQRNFPTGMADTMQFGYAYLISQNGVYTQLDSTLDFRDSLAGDFQVCGFSYKRDELVNLPLPDNSLTIDDIRINLDGLTPWLCAELTTDCLDLHIVAPPDTTFLSERICIGDSVVVGLDTFSQTGEYFVDILSYAGCDSTIMLDLFVQEVQTTLLDSILCLGDSATVGSSIYYETGVYRDTLASAELGCDSIVLLSLTMLDTLFTNINPVICIGDGFLVGDSLLQTPGIHRISLTSVAGCDSIVTADVQVLNPIAAISNTGVIDCNNPTQTLNSANSSPFSQLGFRWFNTEGTILGQNATLAVDTAGTYILEAIQVVGETQCFSRDTIVVQDVRVYPIADPGPNPDTLLTCAQPIILLGGESTSMGGEFTYEWQFTDQGHFVGDPTNRQVDVDSAGIYQLIVTNILTGCADTSSVEVLVDQTPPLIDTGLGFELNCAVLQDTLDGSASAVQPNYVLTWTGNCVNDLIENGLITVDCPGQYVLDVFNPDNGCRAQDSVLVTQNIDLPTAVIADHDTLDCSILDITLDANSSSPAPLNYLWTAPDTNTSEESQFIATLAGNYELIVTRQDNFCKDTTTTTVIQDTISPIANIESDAILTCREPTSLLNGPLTSSGPDFIYQWLENGISITEETTDSLRVNIFGTYSLIVEDTTNSCRDTAQINITEDFLPPPPIDAGGNQFLDCANESVQLHPDSTIFSEAVTFAWSGPCVIQPDDNWGVFVDCPGLYTLEVTNVENGCTGEDDMMVGVSDNYSIATLPDSIYLSCETGTVVINTDGSSNGIQRWFLDGVPQFFSPSSPTVSEPGSYTLIIDNNQMTCSDTATVEVLIECNVEAIIPSIDTLTCTNESILLDASNSIGEGELSYQWSTSMDISCILGSSTSPTLEVLCPGEYQVIVSNEAVNEHDTLLVTVTQDIVRPIVEAGENILVDCILTQADLLGTVEGNSADFSVAWTNALDDTDTLSHSNNYSTTSAGIYVFSAMNIANGCSRSDFVQVNLDTIRPRINFGNEFFTCNADSFQLQAFVLPPDDNYSYLWTGAGILENADSLSVTIDDIGPYTFTVTNEDNGCDSTATIQVVEENCAPCLQIAPIDSLDCLTETITIFAEFCMPCVDCNLQWAFNDEDIIDANELSLTVSFPGNYTLTATDPLGLSTDTTVTVVQMNDTPDFTLGPDLSINCDSTNYTLAPQELNALPPLQYEWFLLEDMVSIGMDSQLIATSPGTYRLLITQLTTSCTATDTIVIDENFTPPIADAGENGSITCENTAIILDGSNSSLINASYQWNTTENTCIAGEQSISPIVSCPGWYYLTVTSLENGCSAVDSVEVMIDEELPILIPFPDTSLTCANPSISLLGNIPTDGQNYEYRWCELNGLGEEISPTCQFSLTYDVNSTGNYAFTVRNTVSGCSNSFTVNVGIDTLPPMVDAGIQDTLFCNLSSLTLQALASENSIYTWTNTDGLPIDNANTLTPIIYHPATYTLTVESIENGCINTDSVLIQRDDETPILEAGLDTLLDCNTEQIELIAEGSTASGQTGWIWTIMNTSIDTIAITPNILVYDTAWYFVELTDPLNGCYIQDSIYVGRDISPPLASIANADQLVLDCFQDTLLLDASSSISSTGIGLAYEWRISAAGSLFPNTDTEQVMTDSAGVYQLHIEDLGNGCLDTLFFTVSANQTPPNLSIAIPDSLTCIVEEVELSTLVPTSSNGFEFEWKNTNQVIISEDQTATTSESGWHYLQLQSLENGCTHLDSVLVISDTSLPIVNIQTPLPITCDREVVVLDGSESSTGTEFIYQWQVLNGGVLLGNTQNTQDSTNIASDYQLTIINTLTGCLDSNQISVFSEGQPITGLEIEVFNPPCENDLFGSISINGINGGTPTFSYRLNSHPQDNISFFDDLPVGNYEIEVIDSEGCLWAEIVTIEPATDFHINLGVDTLLQLGDSIQLSPQFSHPADTLIWSATVIDSPIVGNTPYILPFETQFVLLEAIDSNGCSARDTIQITVVNNRPSYFPSAFSPNGDGDNDLFTVYAGDDVVEVKTLKIFSRWGNLVYERNNFSPNNPLLGWDGQLNGTPLNTAVFVYYAELLYQDQWIEVVTGDVLLLR